MGLRNFLLIKEKNMTSNTLTRTRFIGFDNIWKELDRISSTPNDLYPPHNIVKLGDTTVIELAIAGFSKDDLSLELKDNILTVTGAKNNRHDDSVYVHRGISTKKFSKSFRLSEYAEVTGATITDGILSVSVSVKVPQEKLPKLIPIN
jgi:molecular chaperone IbpA